MAESAPANLRMTLRLGPRGHESLGWWGMSCLIATEAALFALLLFAYAYVAVQSAPEWLPGEVPSMKLALPNTLILLASSLAVWFGERQLKNDRRSLAALGLVMAAALGAVFLMVQGLEWSNKSISLSSGPYGSFYFTITGFHMAHVAGGVVGLTLAAIWTMGSPIKPARTTPTVSTAAYWHFVDIVWLLIFFTFYLAPRLA